MTSARTSSAPGAADLRKLAEASYDPYLEDLRATVNVDCGTYLPAGVNQVADLMQSRFADRGWRVERIPHAPPDSAARFGDILVATLNGRRTDGRRVLLVGHMDTVFPEGTAAERPFRVHGSTAYGPGVSDMKGGLLEGFYAVSCLQEAGFDDFGSITYVCNPDEEIGSPFSGPLILERARSADVCFVLEGARENGDIVSSRKGVQDTRIVYRGRAAHAGVEPERGRSATLQAAHTTIALHQMNGLWPEVTVNVGVIQGGTRPNVVAERCELQVDLRAVTAKDFQEALDELGRRAGHTVVPDVTVEVRAQSGFPPMEKTEATAGLVARAKALAGELGFELNDAATGGASDANPVAAIGVPTLDGLGPIGGADHAPGEWLDLDSVVPRMALLAGLIASP
ncbi:MAG TPA: M20 family metallopeptidase [Actinomycetota bacterium]|nr:M20 family metallopeptidase [Actinomycetota bacterium]